MKFDFDAELRSADGAVIPVYCEVQRPHVGGQKSLVHLAVPAQHITKEPPLNPCTLLGKSGAFTISIQGVHWRSFPISSKSTFGLEAIELLHIEKLTIQYPQTTPKKEIRFHMAPISYLRSKSSFVHFGDRSHTEELFVLDLPCLGVTKFVAEWVTIYHRDAEIPGATVIAGFSAVAGLPPAGPIDVDRMVAKFRSSLEVLSVLFRQAVSLHGWTYTDGRTVFSTWIDPLEPNVTPSARENRGDFVARPQVFVECATSLAHAYGKADEKTRSLVRHLSVAVNPHTNSRTADRFLFMFSALERVIEFAWKRDPTPKSPAVTTHVVIKYLEQLKETVVAEGSENASEISARLGGLINVVDRPSVRDKFEAFFRVYPTMTHCCADLWPILGSDKERGLREIRNALAHGRSSFVSLDVVAVADWHLAILLERVIFVLLDMTLPDGLSPGSFLLQRGGRGWYERDWWVSLRSKPDQPI
ncbi:MAG: hypothetical protein WAW41_22330 [Methylobacter sp.]